MIAENNCLKFDNARLETKVKQNVQQSNSSENYSRRNNIVLRGIVETDNETNDNCEEEVKTFLLNKLKDDRLDSKKKFCILSEIIIFHKI